MAEETRLNNGFSVQVSLYQQEALNLCGFFSSLTWRGRKEFGHPAEQKNRPLSPKEGTRPSFDGCSSSGGFWVSVGWPVDTPSPGSEEGYECEGGFFVEQTPGT